MLAGLGAAGVAIASPLAASGAAIRDASAGGCWDPCFSAPGSCLVLRPFHEAPLAWYLVGNRRPDEGPIRDR